MAVDALGGGAVRCHLRDLPCPQVGIDVANHVREFLCNADMGVRMTGGGNPDKTAPMAELVKEVVA